MHLTAMHPPIRTALLGSRISTQPILSVAKPFTSFQQQQQMQKKQQPQQHRSLSTRTSPPASNSLRRPRLRPQNTHNTPSKPIVEVITTTTTTSSSSSSTSFFTPGLLCRHASTTTTPQSRSAPTPNTTLGPASTSPSTTPPPLDWNTFFRLRKSRRRFSLTSSILTSLGTTAVGAGVISSSELDSWGAQVMGLDPFVALGLATFACGGLGWLAGPFVGTWIWRMLYRRWTGEFASKEKGFYDRIKKYRVDPSSSSAANPVPDYYGEKIGSVGDYRQWLKDQRAFNRKRRMYLA